MNVYYWTHYPIAAAEAEKIEAFKGVLVPVFRLLL